MTVYTMASLEVSNERRMKGNRYSHSTGPGSIGSERHTWAPLYKRGCLEKLDSPEIWRG